MASLTLTENSTKTNVESWFVPFDILMLTCNVLSIILATLFLITIILDRTCRTVPMMLVGNSCLSIVIFGSAMIFVTAPTLEKDLKQIEYQDSLCVLAGYLNHVTPAIQNYSFLLQAIYRYLLIVYPTRLLWHSCRIQLLFICISWIFSFVYPMVYVFTGQMIYDVDNQVCQMPLRLSVSVAYLAICVYGIPISMTMFIYFILVRYVKKMDTHVTPINTLLRAQRNLKMIQRTVILVTFVLLVCFLYQLFLVMSFFNSAPKYSFRIAFLFGDVLMLCVIITLFLFTEPLKMSVVRRINRQANIVMPALS